MFCSDWCPPGCPGPFQQSCPKHPDPSLFSCSEWISSTFIFATHNAVLFDLTFQLLIVVWMVFIPSKVSAFQFSFHPPAWWGYIASHHLGLLWKMLHSTGQIIVPRGTLLVYSCQFHFGTLIAPLKFWSLAAFHSLDRSISPVHIWPPCQKEYCGRTC